LGQQQLLLIVLGVIIVGLALFVGIYLFKANAVESKRNIIINELINLAAMSQQYYLRPIALGGGGRKFTGWRVPDELQITAAGHYTAQVFSDSVVVIAVGNEIVTNNDSLRIQMNIQPAIYKTIIIN
jgi:hypothetical protein